VPDNVVDLVPKHLQPTQGDFLMAAAIMDQQGKFQVAGGDEDFGVGKRPVLQIDPTAQSMHATGPGIVGYHSTAKPFEKYDESFIGSGMGHNYNGYGFYLSESPQYATSVRNTYQQTGVVQAAKFKGTKEDLFDLDAPVSKQLLGRIEELTGEKVGEFGGRYSAHKPGSPPIGRDALTTLEGFDGFRQALDDYSISTNQQGASRWLASQGFKGNTYTDAYGRHYVIYGGDDLSVQGVQK
jgi:hypothetical protein